MNAVCRVLYASECVRQLVEREGLFFSLGMTTSLRCA